VLDPSVLKNTDASGDVSNTSMQLSGKPIPPSRLGKLYFYNLSVISRFYLIFLMLTLSEGLKGLDKYIRGKYCSD
jgi:hypothetical protein